jgi:hypothetical protein
MLGGFIQVMITGSCMRVYVCVCIKNESRNLGDQGNGC